MLLGQSSPAFVLLSLRAAFIAPLLLGATMLSVAAAGSQPQVALSPDDERLLDEIEHTGFKFFAEQAHPRTGLVRDRARADGSPNAGKASIAASGFAFNAWVIATERGWVTRPEALTRVRSMLHFLVSEAARLDGFFYLFI